ncbi:hypothetical protein [Acidipila sp. EB88]|uniref:hypothetical protein n=1 Tax=Acidipila sp. EB88 TaxID=2305226 RepID=UPI000F5F72B8|nr:hypothetical protein [Acidipila sp. EB88]RRA47843.1 hypothetical protein D1Y84_05585 [Acidipila sp. EB88]
MSFVEDARKLSQDFVAPELRASLARFDASDKLAAERHAALPEKLDATRREIELQVQFALATRKIEDLQAVQQAAPQL